MDPVTIAALLGAAAISSAGAYYTNQQNIKYANEANAESVALANTAHQREVRDLRAAGLNPILSASGSGSATPQLRVPGLTNPVESVGNNANSLANALNGLTKSQIETAQAEMSSAKSEADMLARQNELDKINKQVEGLEQAATYQALTDGKDPETGRTVVNVGDPNFAYHSVPWLNLVEQKKNEIESGRYLSSKEHAIYEDIKSGAGTIIEGINSASGFRRAASAIRRDNSAIKRDNWEMTRPRGQQKKVKQK